MEPVQVPILVLSNTTGLVNVGNVTGNAIGNQSATNNLLFTSTSTSAGDVFIYQNNGSSNVVFSNNIIGGISVTNTSTGAGSFYGTYFNTSYSATAACSNNIIGGTVSNSISVSAQALHQ